MEFERTARTTRELNLTPLVDIILMLVIFFMLSTSFIVSESMELSLPDGKAAPTATPDILRIQVMPDGSVIMNQQPMARDALNQFLVNQLGNNPDTRIAIFTTPGASVQQMVSVLDEVYLTGGRNVQVDKVEYVH